MSIIWKLTIAQLKMYIRDRQSLLFALFFPVFFMLALGFMVGQDKVNPIDISVVSRDTEEANQLVETLEAQELLSVHKETEAAARESLSSGDRRLVVIVPESYSGKADSPTALKVLVDSGKPSESQQALAILQSTLIEVEREIRGEASLFSIDVEDVASRQARYIDFLIPGLIALIVMQLSISGSGFNIVEYKRKGILKRLFVTPLRPIEFIVALIISRLLIILLQVSFMLLIGKIVFDISIVGSWLLLYLFAILGGVLFLALGFVLGGIANTQNSVMTIGNLFIFPQTFLSGVFFPLDALPTWFQPLAKLLPLSFVSDAMRQVANEGAQLATLSYDIIGISVWIVIGVFLAVYFFKWGENASA